MSKIEEITTKTSLTKKEKAFLTAVFIIMGLFAFTMVTFFFELTGGDPVYLLVVYEEQGHSEQIEFESPVERRSHQRFVFRNTVENRNYRIHQQVGFSYDTKIALNDGFAGGGMYTSRSLTMSPGIIFIEYCDDVWGQDWITLFVIKITSDAPKLN